MGTDKISVGTLGYICARNRQRQYDLVIKELKQSGIKQADLARRLDKAPEVICRLLARPGNWEADTFSELLFAISGAVALYQVDHPLDRRRIDRLPTAITQIVSPTKTPTTTVLVSANSGIYPSLPKGVSEILSANSVARQLQMA
jgi:hypothetical protein